MSKIRAIWRLGVNYIKHDLKEIIAPSSLPNPPGYKPPPPLTLRKAFERFRGALQGYIATWNPEKLQEELRKRGEADDVDDVGTKAELQGVLDDLSAVAKGGSRTLKPYLTNLYYTRLAAYKDGVHLFVQGYKEGFREGSTEIFDKTILRVGEDKQSDPLIETENTPKEEGQGDNKSEPPPPR